jgi:hypothetical protein
VVEEHQDMVKNLRAEINTKLGIEVASFTVVKAWVQVVAGTKYFFHLKSDDGK